MNVLGIRDVDEIVFDAPFLIAEQMPNFLHIDVVVEPSIDIDYPKDSADPFEIVRTRGKSLSDKLAALTKKSEHRAVELIRVELPVDEVLRSEELMHRITKNREVYEERNKHKS